MNLTGKKVRLKYTGRKKGVVFSMEYLEAGPYDFSTGYCDVSDDDSERLKAKNPNMFEQVDASDEKQNTDDRFACRYCSRVYSRLGDLNNHLRKMHPELIK